jgi:hypothetical protein
MIYKTIFARRAESASSPPDPNPDPRIPYGFPYAGYATGRPGIAPGPGEGPSPAFDPNTFHSHAPPPRGYGSMYPV